MKKALLLLLIVLGLYACKNILKDKPVAPEPSVEHEIPQSVDPVEKDADQTEVATIEVPRPEMNDSIKLKLDSIMVKLGTIFKCRITSVIGNDNAQAYYSGYDGRQNQKITDFSAPIEIGSCTKMVTASAVLQLVEQQKVSLDDPLVSVLPSETFYNDLLLVNGKNYIDSVKIVHLLNHSSGLPDYFGKDDEKEIERYGDSSLTFTPNQLIAMAKENVGDQFVPGTSYTYCNLNYIFLGLIIEKLTGQTYQEYIQKNILDPLALEHTYFRSVNPPNQLAFGHYKGKETVMPPSLAGSAGEIRSTLEDMQKFIGAWSNGTLFENPSSMEIVKSEHFMQMEDIIDMQYGLGVIRLLGRSLGHAGQTFGFQAYIATLFNGYRFALSIDDASVDAWLPAVQLTMYLGDTPKVEPELEVEALQ